MIYDLLGKLCDAEALTNSDVYAGYCLDLVAATQNLPGGSLLWLVLSTNVAADYTTGDEQYRFIVRTGTGTDGTDINAGALDYNSTGVLNGNDSRLATAGQFIMRQTLDMGARGQRYLQLYYDQTGTTPSITVDFIVAPYQPRTDYNIQVAASPVGVP